MLHRFFEKYHIFYGWVVVACGILVMSVTHGIVQNCFSLFIKPVTEALGFSRQSFSVCQTLTNVIYMVIALFSGKIFVKFRVGSLMRIACVVLPVAYFCFSLCSQLWMFYLAAAVVGVATAFLTFLPFTLIIAHWFEEKRGLAVGVCFMGSGLGGMLFNALAGSWVGTMGWQNTYRTLAIIMAAVMIPVVYLVLRTRPQEVGLQPLGGHPEQGQDEHPAYGYTLKQARRTVGFWAMILIALTVGFTSTSLSNNIVPHLSDIGFKPTYASGVMSAYLGVLSVCKIRSTFIAVSAVIVGLTGLLLGQYAPAHLLIVAGASLGCAVGTVAYPILTQAAFGTLAYTSIYGFISAANSLACSLAPVFSNAVYDATGSYNGALLTSVVLTILALCLLAFVRPLAPGAQIEK